MKPIERAPLRLGLFTVACSVMAGLYQPFRHAIRAGFVALVGAQVAGGVMIATGMRLVFGGDPHGAYAMGGWLKPVHGVLMHGILVLPLLAWLMTRSNWDERSQMRGVNTAIAVYALVVTVTLMTAFNAT